MILQSLVRYYEILAARHDVPEPGYCMARVSFALNLSGGGELLGILSLKKQEKRGKKTVEVPLEKEVPVQATKTVNVCANFLCDNSSYFLGIDKKGKPERTRRCFEASRALHRKILSGVLSAAARAVLGFFEKWEPEQAAQHPAVREKLEELLQGGNLIFMIDGGPFAQDDPAIRRAWEAYRASLDSGPRMPCLVTGKDEPVAILHSKIKGVAGAQSVGANLVSFNSSAYESFGRDGEQGLNAPVGKYAAFAYVTALNHLLADREHRQTFGDTTVVYWAENPDPVYRDIFGAGLNPQTEDANRLLDSVMGRMAQGKPVADNIDMETPFYILGLSPNAARLSVRFFLRNSFGFFLQNLKRHYDDLKIAKAPHEFPYLTLYWLLQETVNKKSNDKSASPLMSGETLKAVLLGRPYPQALQEAVLLRIRAEQDDPDHHIQKITRGRAAILKACLLRKSDNDSYKEVLTVSLNEESDNRAYVLGRLFAVLEKAQRDANPGINSTIKDRYFTSACTTPSSVFPTLLKLYQNHLEKIRKAEKGQAIHDDKLVCGLMGKLKVEQDPFPAHLFLNDQSIFILGYYHQVQSFFTPKSGNLKDSRQNQKEDA